VPPLKTKDNVPRTAKVRLEEAFCMGATERTVFISHISEEALVAEELKRLIERAFGPGSAFLSSDYQCLRGG
ncbi:MAG: hypothetical protein AAB225_08935, partial [Acidobacteriota bacterium]